MLDRKISWRDFLPPLDYWRLGQHTGQSQSAAQITLAAHTKLTLGIEGFNIVIGTFSNSF